VQSTEHGNGHTSSDCRVPHTTRGTEAGGVAESTIQDPVDRPEPAHTGIRARSRGNPEIRRNRALGSRRTVPHRRIVEHAHHDHPGRHPHGSRHRAHGLGCRRCPRHFQQRCRGQADVGEGMRRRSSASGRPAGLQSVHAAPTSLGRLKTPVRQRHLCSTPRASAPAR
jgi:hypothetical protein